MSIVQVKNGPIDFQPREPFHPLFGQMPHTRLAFEGQITREYLGQNTGVVYLGPMWTEALNADTCSPHCGTPVSATVERHGRRVQRRQPTENGLAPTSIRRIGTRSAASPGTRICRLDRSPTSGPD